MLLSRTGCFLSVLFVSLMNVCHADALSSSDLQTHTIALAPQTNQTFHYYTLPSANQPSEAIIIIHGHARNVLKTAVAGQALQDNIKNDKPLIVVPFFAVSDAAKCSNPETPDITPGQASWTCSSWLNGGQDTHHQVSAFQAIDHVVQSVIETYPDIKKITIAGFSAGAQFTQHYVGFSDLPSSIKVRFLISDPGSWLYFSSDRPVQSEPASCPDYNHWKYGMDELPAYLDDQKQNALQKYRDADITYFVGADDNSKKKRAFYHILDKSCAAMTQGTFRRDRAENYAKYDQNWIKPQSPRQLLIVPDCGHQISCVFKSKTMADFLNHSAF